MSWSVSAIFQQSLLNPLMGKATGSTNPTTFGSWTADTIDVALFLTGATPDKTAAFASIGYNTGSVWTTANEAPGTGGYTQGGTALASKANTVDSGSSSLCFTAANPSWTSATISGVFGDFVYDASITATGSTVTKQGLCFNYFGGSQSVTSGTFTIQWATPPSGGVTAVFNVSV
ncbi:MAG TPA: hypothetical protein VGG75_38415 [Trebonia sp.]|jgi:hypothetical protein